MSRREKSSVEQKSHRAGDSADGGDQAAHNNGLAQQDRVMQPYHMNTRSTHRMATRSRQQLDELNTLTNSYNRDRPPPEDRRQATMYRGVSRRYQDEMMQEQEGHYEVDPMLPAELENIDPSPDFGDSSGNSLESQQWSDTEGTNRPQTAEHGENREVSCRVSWCEYPGKRYGLCWAHGGVKKCCQRNCPKIARETGEFCSIHEREISASTF